MHLLGVQWRKPTYKEFTEGSLVGLALWLAGVAAMVQSNPQVGVDEVGALLILVWWCSVAARLGMDLRNGWRPLAVNLGVAAVLLSGYGMACRVLFA